MQKIRAFPSRVEFHHTSWLADVLDLSVSEGGIDLGDNEICVELKCRYDKWKSSGHAIHDYQVEKYEKENPDRKLFWAFMRYGLKESPKEIPKNADLDEFIENRQVWMLPWDWIKQFPVSHPRTGPYRYVHAKNILASAPFVEYKRDGGKLYLPKGCEALEQRLL